MPNLQRFIAAQNAGNTYQKALKEIERGRKTNHWIWYVFPQIQGMGKSYNSKTYALSDLNEAQAYLLDPLLYSRYQTILFAAHEQLQKGTPINVLMGSQIDAQKLNSSLTLFEIASFSLAHTDEKYKTLGKLCSSTLDIIKQQGIEKCRYTQKKLPRPALVRKTRPVNQTSKPTQRDKPPQDKRPVAPTSFIPKKKPALKPPHTKMKVGDRSPKKPYPKSVQRLSLDEAVRGKKLASEVS